MEEAAPGFSGTRPPSPRSTRARPGPAALAVAAGRGDELCSRTVGRGGGSLAVGSPADLALVDLSEEWTVGRDPDQPFLQLPVPGSQADG
jgi:dihydroorotase